jgi:hypothetical protein
MPVNIMFQKLVLTLSKCTEFLEFDKVYYEFMAAIKLSRNVTTELAHLLQDVGRLHDALPSDRAHDSMSTSRKNTIAAIVAGVNGELDQLTTVLARYNSILQVQILSAREMATDILKEITRLKGKISTSTDNITAVRSVPTTTQHHRSAYSSAASVDNLSTRGQTLQGHKNQLQQLQTDMQPKTHYCQAMARKVYPVMGTLVSLLLWLSIGLSRPNSTIFVFIANLTMATFSSILVISYQHSHHCVCWLSPPADQPDGE